MISRVLEKLCDTGDVLKMIAKKSCRNFHVLPIETFYAIQGPDYFRFFEEKFLNRSLEVLEESTVAHFWNKNSASTPLKVDDNVAYIHLAKKFCPKVLKASKIF